MSETAPQIPQLVEIDGPRAGRYHPLPYGVHVVGRGGRASVRLDHGDVSREHAHLDVGPEGVTIRDADSKNGVWVEGQRLGEPRLLGHDERFSLGELSLRVIHPASQVTRALAAGGESTVTADHLPAPVRPGVRPLLVPMIGVLVFGVLVIAMLVQ